MIKHFGLGQLVWIENVSDKTVYGWARVPRDGSVDTIDIADGQASVIAGPVQTTDLIGPVYHLATPSGPIWVRAAMMSKLQADGSLESAAFWPFPLVSTCENCKEALLVGKAARVLN
jgi:hypothetical protein